MRAGAPEGQWDKIRASRGKKKGKRKAKTDGESERSENQKVRRLQKYATGRRFLPFFEKQLNEFPCIIITRLPVISGR